MTLPAFFRNSKDALPDGEANGARVGQVIERHFHDKGNVLAAQHQLVESKADPDQQQQIQPDHSDRYPHSRRAKEERREHGQHGQASGAGHQRRQQDRQAGERGASQ